MIDPDDGPANAASGLRELLTQYPECEKWLISHERDVALGHYQKTVDLVTTLVRQNDRPPMSDAGVRALGDLLTAKKEFLAGSLQIGHFYVRLAKVYNELFAKLRLPFPP